ncbi:hypothetical protein OGZ51_13470 [Lactococcus lactis]|uniref:Uncharacterized protein n=1 Tax=Lactococcus lactis TaxID=1358 RepID=A0A9X4NJC8_9LACT|nr:hypothetical protein [Lactococcus lactis]MDG4985150.1 hypothetical protein [Lactococcus lactis]
MNKLEITSFEYAVSVFNEIAMDKDAAFIPFEIIWDTSLGIAKAKTIIYDRYNEPVINESIRAESIHQKSFDPGAKDNDSFSFIRHEVFNYFRNTGFGRQNLHLLKRPDLLMVELLELSKVDMPSDIVTPNYSTILDFETLDGTMKLPFIHSDSIEIKEPISLISKN